MASVEPKPFAYVGIAAEAPKRAKCVPHQTVTQGYLTGRIALELEVVSDYIFVGSGSYDFVDNMVYYSFARSGDHIMIQGMSIKGAVRSILEAISNSCVSQFRNEERDYIPQNHIRCDDVKNLCPACRMFGATTRTGSYAGRVSFSDALPTQIIGPEIVKISKLFPPQQSSGKRKFYQDKRASAISDRRPERNIQLVEVLKRGSKLRLHADFQNLTPDELSLLLYSLGIKQDYYVKIGGAKPRGFGSVTFRPLVVELWKPPFGDLERIEGADLERYLGDIMTKGTLIREDLLQQYVKETGKGRGLTTPRGVY